MPSVSILILRTVFLFVLTMQLAPIVSAEPFWRRLMPVDRKPAAAAPAPAGDGSLQQTNGPWLIMAATFSGEGAQEQAAQLVNELRSQHRLRAYLHDMQFDLTSNGSETINGKGLDKYGAPVKMRYRKGNQVREWAVLVGDFTDVDDSAAQKTLDQIKTLHPEALRLDREGGSTQSLANIRAYQAQQVDRLRSHSELGPMRTAFLTRNPLLPQEYFVPKGVDKFVEKMNKGVKYSLLDNQGKYSVKVATFRGKGVLQGASITGKPSNRSRRKHDDPLMEAAENAHLLAEQMRAQGWKAYEFHDRDESIVTVGSFESVGHRGAGGQEVPTEEVMRIMHTFGAAYNTPSDPLQEARLPLDVQAKAEQRLSKFNEMFNGEHGQVAGGYNPKFARHPPKDPNARIIPFDIHPHVVEVPKRTVSSAFAWRR